MKITDYADILNLNIKITYYHNQDRWAANFENAEIKDNPGSCILISEYGDGRNVRDAVDDYVKKIAGKILVFEAARSGRREYLVPGTLEGL